MKFLIVDDDSDILVIAEKLLTSQKHQVLTAENALTAIDILNHNDVDILISDATMPEYSGFDLIRSLKRNKNFAAMTIAMLTGRSEPEDIEHALELGVQDYIVKPIEPETFLKKIDLLIAKHLQRRQKMEHLQFPTATMTSTVKVTRITDVGISIESPSSLEAGSIVEINCDELTRHMIFKNRFRVIFSRKIPGSNQFSTEFLILDLSYHEKETLEKLSSQWMLDQRAS